MEQKNYKMEILIYLTKNPSYIRNLARVSKTNHMMIKRKIDELLKENVVDYKIEGKNKTYFIKKSIEAKSYIYMAEQYKLINVLKKYPSLRNIIEKIKKIEKIKLALLFGSYVKDTSNKKSDIDIFIETTDKRIKKDVELLDTKLNVKIGIYNKDNNLIKEIEKNNIIIKGVEEYYERNKIFN